MDMALWWLKRSWHQSFLIFLCQDLLFVCLWTALTSSTLLWGKLLSLSLILSRKSNFPAFEANSELLLLIVKMSWIVARESLSSSWFRIPAKINSFSLEYNWLSFDSNLSSVCPCTAWDGYRNIQLGQNSSVECRGVHALSVVLA